MSSPTNTPSSLPDKLVALNAGPQLFIKLDGDNYPAWRIQFLSLLTGYDLIGYIDGSTPCPSKHLEVTPNTFNPAYTHWIRQDQLILHGIVSSIAATVVTHIGTVQTAKQAWDTLKSMYAGRSRVRIMALKKKISNFNKGTQPMATYLQGIKAISDELSIIDHPLDDIDLVVHTLNGLSVEYREISAALSSKETPINFAELHEKLVDFESFLHRDDNAATESIVVTANAVTRNKGQQRSRQNFSSSSSLSTALSSNHKVVCQFCEKPGHIARNCYKIKGYPNRNGYRPSANIATNQPPVHNSSWIMDTGASHHVTQDLQQLSLANPYPGTDQVIVGDGTGMNITHIGHTSLHTQTKPLFLNQVLHVPSIQSNLLSVSKLCQTNHSSVEFFPDCFVVKDLNSGQALLQGPLKQDLYHLSSPSIPSNKHLALTTSIQSTSNWHHKLGHPSSKIIKHLAASKQIPIKHPSSHECSSCHCAKSHKLPFSDHLTSSRPLELIYSDV